MRRRVYLDHNATAPLHAEAREAMDLALRAQTAWGNPSSPHVFGHEARLSLERSRADVAALIGVHPGEIVFVSGGTEADNLAIQGAARAWTASGRAPGHLIASAVEHPAVLEACRYLETTSWRLTLLPVDSEGLVSPDDLRAAISPDTALVSIMAANNETGVLQPIEEIAHVARDTGVALHVDAVQAAGRIELDARALGARMLSLSAHKIGGPAGIGALWIERGLSIAAVTRGGGQERRLRPGTEPVLLAAGFAAAARVARRRLGEGGSEATATLRDRMEAGLRERLGQLRVNGERAARLPNTSSLTLPGLSAEALVIRMDMAGFALSTGSACSTGSARPSHVLAAMGLSPADAACTVRLSLGPGNTPEEIHDLVESLPQAAAAVERARLGAESSPADRSKAPSMARPSGELR